MIVIFLFSNQTAQASQTVSDNFTTKLIEIFLNKNISSSNKKEIVKKIGIFVRKCAHFSEYFILGIIVFLNLNAYHCNRKLIYSILFCFIYACTDEIHQLFLAGRTAKILDVFIDTFGSVAGCFVIFLLKK